MNVNDANNCWIIYDPKTGRLVETDSAEFDEDATYWPRGHHLGHSDWHEAFDCVPTLDDIPANSTNSYSFHHFLHDDTLVSNSPSELNQFSSTIHSTHDHYDASTDLQITHTPSEVDSEAENPTSNVDLSDSDQKFSNIEPLTPTRPITKPTTSPDILLMSSDDETNSSTLSGPSSENYFDITSHVHRNTAEITTQIHNFDALELFHSTKLDNTASVFHTRSLHSESQAHTNCAHLSTPDDRDLFRSHQLAPDDYCLHNPKLDEYIDFDSRIVFSVNNIEEPPASLAEARLRPDAQEWIESYNAEINSLQERNTWIVRRWRDIPAGRRAIRCKLVFRKKMIGDKIDKYKCRICAKGFSQVKGYACSS